MKIFALFALLAACVSLAAADASDDGPLEFLFSRCELDDSSETGDCVRDLLRTALDRDRPKFATGLQVGGETVVLEPLQMPKPDGASQGRSSKIKVLDAQLAGLSDVQVDSVMLTESTAAAVVEFPQLHGEMRGEIRWGFLPLRPTMKLELLKPRLMVGANWSAPDGELQLTEPHAKLWLDGFNITISGMTSMGKNLAKQLNQSHKEIIEFLKPSLEAAVVRRMNKMRQEERNDALSWLENALS